MYTASKIVGKAIHLYAHDVEGVIYFEPCDKTQLFATRVEQRLARVDRWIQTGPLSAADIEVTLISSHEDIHKETSRGL